MRPWVLAAPGLSDMNRHIFGIFGCTKPKVGRVNAAVDEGDALEEGHEVVTEGLPVDVDRARIDCLQFGRMTDVRGI